MEDMQKRQTEREAATHLILKGGDCVQSHSLNQISSDETDIKKGLRVDFCDEDGINTGDLRNKMVDVNVVMNKGLIKRTFYRHVAHEPIAL